MRLESPPVKNHSAIVYRSRAVKPVSDVELFYLLAQARDRNQREKVTGLLVYDRGHFFQWIEGEDESLGRVWNSIRTDVRHTAIEVLADESIVTRRFEGWQMQLAHRDIQHANVVRGFVVAAPRVLDRLHEDPRFAPAILASLGQVDGSF